MWCNRRLLRISWIEKNRNSEIAAKMGDTCLLKKQTQRKMRHAGYVLRDSSSHLHNLVLEGTIEGTKPEGSPRLKWTDDLFK